MCPSSFFTFMRAANLTTDLRFSGDLADVNATVWWLSRWAMTGNVLFLFLWLFLHLSHIRFLPWQLKEWDWSRKGGKKCSEWRSRGWWNEWWNRWGFNQNLCTGALRESFTSLALCILPPLDDGQPPRVPCCVAFSIMEKGDKMREETIFLALWEPPRWHLPRARPSMCVCLFDGPAPD